MINDIVRKIIPYKGNLLLATHNGIGLFNPETGECVKLLNDSRLNNRQIIDMLVDKKNNLWFSYSLGLIKYNLETQKRNEYFVPNTLKQAIGPNLINVLLKIRKVISGQALQGMAYSCTNKTPIHSNRLARIIRI